MYHTSFNIQQWVTLETIFSRRFKFMSVYFLRQNTLLLMVGNIYYPQIWKHHSLYKLKSASKCFNDDDLVRKSIWSEVSLFVGFLFLWQLQKINFLFPKNKSKCEFDRVWSWGILEKYETQHWLWYRQCWFRYFSCLHVRKQIFTAAM